VSDPPSKSELVGVMSFPVITMPVLETGVTPSPSESRVRVLVVVFAKVINVPIDPASPVPLVLITPDAVMSFLRSKMANPAVLPMWSNDCAILDVPAKDMEATSSPVAEEILSRLEG